MTLRPRWTALSLMLVVPLMLFGAVPAALADPPTDDAATPEYAYAADGTAVEGGASLAQAAVIAPGIHRDTFARGGEDQFDVGTTKFYRIAVEDGQRVHAAATIAAPPYPEGLPEEGSPLAVGVTYLTAAGETCDESVTDDVGEAYTGDGPITSTAVSDVVGPDGCSGDELFLQVTRAGSRAGEEPLPLEIQVAIQPAGIGGGSPAVDEEIEDDGASPVAPDDDAPITLGRSFASATPLESGSSVIELVPGETGLARIEVQEGQRLRWRAEVVSQPEDAGSVSLRAFNAARAAVSVGSGPWTMSTSDPVSGGGMAAPVDLGNRSSELPEVQSAWLPGTYTIQFQRLQRAADADPAGNAPVRIILTLEVDGEIAEDAAEGTLLELGETTSSSSHRGGVLGTDGGLGRIALFAGAGLLALMALVTAVAGVLVLRLPRS